MSRFEARLREALLAVIASAGAAGCVEAYGGSHITLDFAPSVDVPRGTDADGAEVPGDTYFSFYGTDEVLDDEGNVVQNYVFEVVRFEIVPLIDPNSPCFIELEDAQFPGLHATQVARKVRDRICDRLGEPQTCFDDPFNPPPGATDADVTDVLDADVRMGKIPLYQVAIKAVVSHSTFRYPAAAADCAVSGDEIPSPTCTDIASNTQRLRVCRDLWADNPDFYEGSDKVFTLPLNGAIRGLVEGNNPANGAPIGGATVYVDDAFGGFDGFAINWQFKDYDGDGEPDYPDDFLMDHPESDIGYPFLSGRPEVRTRGVIHSHMVNAFDSSISAEVAIFADLAEDDVAF